MHKRAAGHRMRERLGRGEAAPSADVRQMAARLREGARMQELLAQRPLGSGDVHSFEAQWTH